jgi:2-polyprenyl-6-hydroxyphenyl methylase/3-demethylubiquinone-9 3-methyltransferase
MRELNWETRYLSWGIRPRDLERTYSNSRLLERLAEYISDSDGRRVLEIGCAPGRWLAWIGHHSRARVFGVDLNAEGLRLSRHVCEACGLARADGTQLPFGNGVFDLVFSLGVLEHFEDPAPLLMEHRRVLNDAGAVIISVPNIGAKTIQGWHWRHFKSALYEAHVPYSAVELARVMGNAGFADISTSYSGIYAPHLQRVIKHLLPRRLAQLLERPLVAGNLVAAARR